MSFKFENIVKEPITTTIAVAITVVIFWLIYKEKIDYSEASPAIILVVTFLLYGKDKGTTPPAVMLLLLLWVLGSCKPQQVIREVQIVRDTIHLKGETIERNFHYNQKDTVFVKGDKLTMKYYYHHHDSTVFLQGSCKADTIIAEKLVPIEKLIIEEKTSKCWYDYTSYALSVLFLIIKYCKKTYLTEYH